MHAVHAWRHIGHSAFLASRASAQSPHTQRCPHGTKVWVGLAFKQTVHWSPPPSPPPPSPPPSPPLVSSSSAFLPARLRRAALACRALTRLGAATIRARRHKQIQQAKPKPEARRITGAAHQRDQARRATGRYRAPKPVKWREASQSGICSSAWAGVLLPPMLSIHTVSASASDVTVARSAMLSCSAGCRALASGPARPSCHAICSSALACHRSRSWTPGLSPSVGKQSRRLTANGPSTASKGSARLRRTG